MAAALALALAVVAAPAPAPAAFPYPVHPHTLDNGLSVLLVPYDSPGLAALFTVFRVGSRDEVEAGRSGFAHFFEHLTYRGTTTRSAEAWERETKALGVESNAFTDDDLTAYWVAGPSAALPSVIALEADRFRNLAYSEDDFKLEARAVLGELLKGVVDPDFRVAEAARDLAFTRHTYKHTPLGFERDVRDMPSGYRASLELYRRFYAPGNAVVIVVGDLDEERTLAAIRGAYGPWAARGTVPPAVPSEPPQRKPRESRLPWDSPILPRLWSGWHTPGAGDVDATAAQLVLWPYLFARPAPLHRELVVERRLVRTIGAEFQPHRDPYLFGYELVLEAPQAEADARAAVDRAVAAVARGDVDARWLADVKANVRAGVVMQTDTPYRTGVWLAYYTALTGDAGYLSAVLERVAAISPADLSAFVRRHLVAGNRTTVVVAAEPARAAARGTP